MKFSEDLFELIKSLKPPEKRFFKVFSSRHVIGERNNYVLLFDAINEMKEYDEHLLKHQLEHEPFVKHIATEKFRLYELILKSLRGYREKGNTLCEIQSIVREVEILTENDLHDQARRRLKKAKELAERYEDFLSLMRLLTLERMHLQHSQEPDIRRRLSYIDEETEIALRNLTDQTQLQSLYDVFFSYVRGNLRGNNSHIISEIEELYNNPLLHRDDGYTFYNHLRLHGIHALYYQIRGDIHRAMEVREQIVNLWKRDSLRIRDNPQKFTTALANLVSCCISLGDEQPYRNTLKQLESLRATAGFPSSVFTEIEHNIHHLRLLYILNTGTIEEEPALPVIIGAWMQAHGEKINSARYLAIHYNLGMLYFLTNNFPFALKHIEKALSVKKTAARKDIQAAARLMAALIHYEQKESSATRSCYSSAQSFIIQHKIESPYLSAVLDFLKQLADCTRASEVRELCRSVGPVLKAFISEPGKSNPIGSAELSYWIESRSTGVAMTVILKRAVEQRRAATQN